MGHLCAVHVSEQHNVKAWRRAVRGWPLGTPGKITIASGDDFRNCFAAADIVVCGGAAPQLAFDIIERALAPVSQVVYGRLRGQRGAD